MARVVRLLAQRRGRLDLRAPLGIQYLELMDAGIKILLLPVWVVGSRVEGRLELRAPFRCQYSVCAFGISIRY